MNSKKHIQFENSDKGIAHLLKLINSLKGKIHRVVLEPSGGYERKVLTTLTEQGFPVSMVHAQRIRYFAKSMKDIAKTDVIDAHILAVYGQKMEPALTQLKSESQEELSSWTRHRDVLQEQLLAEKRRLDKHIASDIVESIERHCAYLEAEISSVDKQLGEILKESFDLEVETLGEVVGVGKQTICKLLGELPEIGRCESQYIVRMAGLAPMNNESGKSFGHRSIRGGRKRVRKALYMAVISAIRWNKNIQPFYKKLKGKGKPTKVALTACMGKLLRILNGRLLSAYAGNKVY